MRSLLEDVDRVELRAKKVQMSPSLKKDLEEVLAKHGGELEFIGHPTTTLEDLFLRIVEESKAHPKRRYLPELDKDAIRKPAQADGLGLKDGRQNQKLADTNPKLASED